MVDQQMISAVAETDLFEGIVVRWQTRDERVVGQQFVGAGRPVRSVQIEGGGRNDVGKRVRGVRFVVCVVAVVPLLGRDIR